MFEYICFILGIIIIIYAVVHACKNRFDTSKFISSILIGIILSTFCFVLPTKWTSDNIFCPVSYQIVSSILYAFKTIGGRQDIAQLESINLSGAFKVIYFIICYIMFILAPILTSGLIISFFGDMVERIRYALCLKKKCYIFSELNENSLSFANGIKNSEIGFVIVFCNTKDVSKNYKIESKKIGGINLYKSCVDFKITKRRSHYEFFLISDSEDSNTKYTTELIEKNKQHTDKNIVITSFTSDSCDIDILESADKGNIKLCFINRAALLCNNIVFNHPLYNTNGKRKISVMIVGCGKTGTQMLKTVLWCGQIEGRKLKIRIYDKNAPEAEKRFYSQAPELDCDEYDIKFIKSDVFSPEFEEQITESLDATYIFVATGDDGDNLHIADNLRGIFRRKTGNFDTFPIIITKVLDKTKTTNILNSSTYLSERNIEIFGNVSTSFSCARLFSTRLEKLAFAVHLACNGVLNAPRDSEKYINAKQSFDTQEYNRRTSTAYALHISAKLFSCGIMPCEESALTDEYADKFESLIKQKPEIIELLAKNEHTRWNAFFRSEGYHGADIETIKKYAHKTGSHKDKLSKTHPCITPWDELDNLSAKYSEISGKASDFKNFDFELIKQIPEIIRYANHH